MNLTNFIPTGWLGPAVGGVCLSLLGFGMVQTDRLHKTQMQFSQAQAAWSDQKAKAANAAQQAEFDARLEEKRRYDAQKAIQDELQHQFEVVRADSVNARAAADRLQQRVATLIAQASKPASNTAAAVPGEATQSTAGMFADVLGRCVTRVRLLAETADERGTAGESCERRYDSLDPSK